MSNKLIAIGSAVGGLALLGIVSIAHFVDFEPSHDRKLTLAREMKVERIDPPKYYYAVLKDEAGKDTVKFSIGKHCSTWQKSTIKVGDTIKLEETVYMLNGKVVERKTANAEELKTKFCPK